MTGPPEPPNGGPPAFGSPGAMGVVRDGLAVAAGNSRDLRSASIYVAILALLLAGPAVVAVASTWLEGVDWLDLQGADAAGIDLATQEAIGRIALLGIVAVVGLAVVLVEGGATSVALAGAWSAGRPTSLRAAVARSRRVFWRLLRAGLVVLLIEVAVAWAWTTFAAGFGPGAAGIEAAGVVVTTLAVAPFVFVPTAVVIGDDGALAAIRHSVGLARRAIRVTAALAGVSLISGVITDAALGSGLDLVSRLAGTIHLDPSASGAGPLAIVIALALSMAAASLLFTVAVLVAATQTVAWIRLGQPTGGLDPVEPERPAEPMPSDGDATVVAPPLSPWQAGAMRTTPFRWISIPMRLAAIGMWLVALVTVASGRPPA